MPTKAENTQVLWQEMEIISILLSVSLSHPNSSESHPSSGAVLDIHSSLVQAAVKNHTNIKIA